MSSSNHNTSNEEKPEAVNIWFKEGFFCVDLKDGRTIMIPLSFYPVLKEANKEQKENWRIFGAGGAIHFSDLDVDIEVEALLVGRRQV